MKNFLENIKTLLAELIGFIGGFIWARHTNWDYEPLILMVVSFIGLVIFFLLRFSPSHEDQPIVELEFVSRGTYRSAPGLIADVSPKDETGQHYVIQEGGIYLFQIKKRYELVIRNNSKNNAYNLSIHKLQNTYPLNFEKEYNSLDPLIIDKAAVIKFIYEVWRPMTHQEAEKLINTEVPDDLEGLILIAKYQSESRKNYFTKFQPLNKNEHLDKFSELPYYEKL